MAPNLRANLPSNLNQFSTQANLKAQSIALALCAVLVSLTIIVPLLQYIRHKNLAACTLIIWLLIGNTFTVVNAIIWHNDDFAAWYDGVGICDLEAKLYFPIFVGIPAAIVCLARNLARCLKVESIQINATRRERVREILIDCCILYLVPLLQIGLHYIVQVNRYYIMAVGGCAPSVDQSWPTIVLFYMWQEIFPLVACYYCVFVIIRLRKYRKSFSAILASSSSRLTKERYLRLFGMSLSMMTVYLPVATYILYVNLDIQWFTFEWSLVHGPDWNSYTPLSFLGIRTLDRWCLLGMTFAVFLFLGVSEECFDMYRSLGQKLGLAKIFPSLAGPRQRRGSASASNGSWYRRFSVILKLKNYFDTVSTQASRKNSQFGLNSMNTIIPETRVSNSPVSPRSFPSTHYSLDTPRHTSTPVSDGPTCTTFPTSPFSGIPASDSDSPHINGPIGHPSNVPVRSGHNISAFIPPPRSTYLNSSRTSTPTHGLQTHIYSPSGYSPHHDQNISSQRLGSSSSESSLTGSASSAHGSRGIQVKKQLEITVAEDAGAAHLGAHGSRVLKRDPRTGDVYEVMQL